MNVYKVYGRAHDEAPFETLMKVEASLDNLIDVLKQKNILFKMYRKDQVRIEGDPAVLLMVFLGDASKPVYILENNDIMNERR